MALAEKTDIWRNINYDSPLRKKTPGFSNLAYQWLEIRMEQHISIGVNGKVVTIRSKLQDREHREGDICERKDGGTEVANVTCNVQTSWFLYVLFLQSLTVK